MPSRFRSSCTTIGLPAGTGAKPWIMKLADAMIAADVVALALVDVDLDLGLVVVDGVEQLAARGRQRRVAVDDRREAILEGEARATRPGT